MQILYLHQYKRNHGLPFLLDSHQHEKDDQHLHNEEFEPRDNNFLSESHSEGWRERLYLSTPAATSALFQQFGPLIWELVLSSWLIMKLFTSSAERVNTPNKVKIESSLVAVLNKT